MNIIPLGDRVVLEPIMQTEKKVGKIIIPVNSENEKSYMARVIALGGEAKDVLGIGDLVLYENYGCTELNVGGHTYLVNKLEGIVCKLEADDE